ncbi:RNA polymerase I termination factor-like [Prunus yedoensis var. nudiflora]|uniref:RNA polymerase I termination factor-like n=1 Tax=Prunus yedoensis var. nudiflora TaxID=2094558 RepID=A0A314Z013_PRUYE|nr:RNA polymerase I termination factor-like [Prunus yedoensis var. nudiflora]
MGREKTTDLEFEARKDKKKLKEKRKKDEADRNSSLIEVSKDKMGELVQVQKFDRNGGEGVKKKKKRKREMKVADSELKSNLTTEQVLIKDCDKSNGKVMEEVDFADKEKKRKKLIEDDKMDESAKRFNCSKDRDVAELNKVEVDKKKKKKKERREKVGGQLVQNITTDGKETEVESEHSDGKIMENGGIMKKEKRKHTKNSRSEMQETVVEKLGTESSRVQENSFLENDGNVHATGDETSNRNIDDVNVEDGNKGKKRAKSEKHMKKAKSDKGSLRTQKSVRGPDLSENSTPKKATKRVSFADDVEVFSPSDGPKDEEKGLVQGKRFSKEEDKLVKEAVLAYIEEHGLGEEGINKVLNCGSNPEIRNCWKDIGGFLPWRPYKSIYYRAHILFERAEERNWTPEEYEIVRRAAMEAKAKGEPKPNWRKVGNELGKHRIHVKDAWRRIKLPNMKKGQWSQEEYQTLFDLVNKDLQMRVLEEKKSKHGMLRDNIKWESISETLGSRTNPVCCQKWYYQLTSPLVTEGLWSDTDDYRLLYALDSLDACCMEDVNWDDLLEHRSGDVCRKRWNQMVKHIGRHGTKSFAEQVEILSKRYCADALEAREVFDSKPVVD